MSDETPEGPKATGRRQALAGLLPLAADVVKLRRELVSGPAGPLPLRPPGAPDEASFLELCTRCDKCVEACPHGTITRFSVDAGELVHTPVINPAERACHLCDGYPCVAACEDGALTPPGERPWPLGKVSVNEDSCFAFKGPECGACVGVCPRDVDAIRLVRWRPVVDREACVGCGVCLEACPVLPAALDWERA